MGNLISALRYHSSFSFRGSMRCVCSAAILLAAACGGPTAPAPPPPVPQLSLACPSAVETESGDGQPVPISFAAPTTNGGQAPVNVTCSIASGATFNVGTTAVACSATDARGISAQCSFSVRVVGPPRLRGTRFVAFGDSITAGKFSPAGFAESEFAYTFFLERQLKERYRFQSPVVINEGISGEIAHINGGSRLPIVLSIHRPDILLLMEGTNDLLTQSGLEAAKVALANMVAYAKGQGVLVAMATVPPQRPAGRAPGVVDRIAALNVWIRQFAAAEGIVLVEVHDAINADLPTLLGVDNLHPTPRGFEVIANTFFEAIKANFEERPPFAPARAR